MAGGDEEAFRRAEPLLRELGQTVTHAGANGKGHARRPPMVPVDATLRL